MRLLELIRPFRIVVTRRVTEEEQVSIEAFCKSEKEAYPRLSTLLAVMREHRKRSNEEVVHAARTQLVALETAITARGEQAHALDEELAKKRAELSLIDEQLRRKQGKLIRTPVSPLVPRSPNGPDIA